MFWKKLLPLFFLLLSIFASAQHVLKGQVIDNEKGLAIANANVFLNNTSIGTRTDNLGGFELNVPAGKFDLVISYIGYETYNKSIEAPVSTELIVVKLKIKVEQLETVVVEPFEKDGWKNWGQFFLDNFIGTSDFARDCKIKNPGVLRFRSSKKTNKLTVIALETLIIENKALGYTIYYQMESLVYDFKTHYLIYTGYPFFEPMHGSETKEKKWIKRRNEAYYGSCLHFMRSLYHNKVSEDGFEIRSVRKIPNLEKQRVKAVYASSKIVRKSYSGKTIVASLDKDTAEYYRNVLTQPDYLDLVGTNILTGDSVAYALSQTVAALEFPDYLMVTYKKKTAPAAYSRMLNNDSSPMTSQLYLINSVPVEVQSNGSYYSPHDLLSIGYWAWSEKMAMMVPFDYVP